MDDKPLNIPGETSHSPRHAPVDLSSHSPTIVSPRQTQTESHPKYFSQASDHLEKSGERKAQPLTPVHTSTSHPFGEGRECFPGEPQKVTSSTSLDVESSELLDGEISRSVENIFAGQRKEISKTVLLAETKNIDVLHHSDVSFRYFALRVTHSKLFNRVMLFVILVNVLCIAFQNETSSSHRLQRVSSPHFWFTLNSYLQLLHFTLDKLG